MGIEVAHFSFGDDYGAMGAAYELHRSLLGKGINSSIFVRNKTRNDDSIIELEGFDSIEERLLKVINTLYFARNRINEGVAPVNFDCLGLQWDQKLENRLKNFDIFHIHWVAGFLSMDNIYQLAKLKKPIVWTMHDFHPFTGGCHCPEACKKYEDDCSNCFMLKQNYSDITKSILAEKLYKYSSDICVVVASAWLKNIVQQSKVFKNNLCEVVPIGIDTKCYVPKNKQEMKRKIGLPADAKVILVGAQALGQNVKGYGNLKHALQIVKSDSYCKELLKTKQLFLLTFGNAAGFAMDEDEIPIINVGFVANREKLCEVYNAADVFIFPSIQDTFGMTAVEAMSCGIPTVTFDVSAMNEVIIQGVNGYKAEVDDYLSMGTYIVQILRDNPIDVDICRKQILNNYSLESETEKMIQLYHKLMTRELMFNNKKYLNENDSKIERFIEKCAFEILTGTAPNQYPDMSIQEILLEYNLKFISPEQKVRKLIEQQKISNKTSIYIYGAGKYGKRTLNELEKFKINIRGFWDLDETKEGKMIGKYSIHKPVKKKKFEGNIILVAGIDYLNMIRQLIHFGYLYCQDFY